MPPRARTPRFPHRPPRPSRVGRTLVAALAALAGSASSVMAAEPVDAGTVAGTRTMEHGRDARVMDPGAMSGHAMTGTEHGEPDGTAVDGTAGGHAAGPVLARTSAVGLYRVELRGLPEPVPLNRMHEWIVHLATADGAPVAGASIAMTGGMPIHDHGLPTAPRVTEELGEGEYRLEGVRFQMAGHWVVELTIDGGAGEDSVAFDLNL